MKQILHITVFLAAFLCSQVTTGQIQVSLQIPNLGSPYLSDYIGNQTNRVLIITNQTGQTREIFLRGSIQQLSQPGYYFRTKEEYRPAVPIVMGPNETKTLFARGEDWAFIEANQLEDNVPLREKRIIQATGLLPEGDYQICVRAFDFRTEQPLSPDEPIGCSFFVVTLGSPPQLLLPICDDTIHQDFPLITWTPAIILQTLPDIRYDLFVVELTSAALNPAEVMEQSILYRGGNPFVVENLRQTFYQFLPGDPPLKKGSSYAICVVAKDARGSAIFENQGRSEICLMHVKAGYDMGPIGPSTGIGIVATEVGPGGFQMLPLSKLEGKLRYRFYGDGTNINIQGGLLGNLSIMNLLPGQSLQNQGYAGVNQGGLSIGSQIGMSGMGPAMFNNGIYQQPPPPQYILPAGYNSLGGKPLKQARVRFTARYAVGKKLNIEHPEDLEFVYGMGYPIRVTGAGLPEMLTFPQATQVLAVTTTNNEGNYSVSFFADETFGMLHAGPVDVQWGGGEFPASASGYGFYRVITMEVEEKWYCHPDVVMFLQPGQSLEVPTQVVTVQSYNMRVKVRATDKADQYAGPHGPIYGAIVKIGRAKLLYDQHPASYPKDEIKIEQYGHLLIGSPVKNVMTADSAISDASGNVTFRRLVKHDGAGGCSELGGNMWPSDVYYVETKMPPTTGDLNYHPEYQRQVAPCPARLPMMCPGNDCAPRSANYTPPLIEFEIKMVPLLPKIVANSRSIYNNVPYNLPNTTLLMNVHHENGDYRLAIYKTDQNGLFTKQFNTGDMQDFLRLKSPGLITSSYVMDYFKSGFKRSFCNGCGTNSTKVNLQFGQRWNVDPHLVPGSFVKGKVIDEHGQPIYGDIKIGDGPYLSLQMTWQVAGSPPGPQGSPFQFSGVLENFAPQNQVLPNPSQTPSPGQPGGLMTQNGFNIEVVGVPQLSLNWEQVSVFSQPAQSGQQIPIIIRPDATNYFADTFYVNIPSGHEAPGFDLGTFVIKERLHRPKIIVRQPGLVLSNDGMPQIAQIPLEGAEVKISNLPAKTTNSQGQANFVFGSPANEFSLRIQKDGFVPYDQYVPIPVSKEPYVIIIDLETGKVLTGTVKRAAGGQPIAGARVYSEIGTNEYGPIILETHTDQNGHYMLGGLPGNILQVKATKTDPTLTYIGQTKSVNTNLVTTVDFQLQEAPFVLSHIWNLPVNIETVVASGNNWTISGAFVDLPANSRFRPEKDDQRLPFTNITIKPTGPADQNGKVPVEPVASSILATTSKFRSILNNAHIVEMSGPPAQSGSMFQYNQQYVPVYISKIRIEKQSGNNGHVRTRAFSLLEYFRMTYNYDGQFFLGETPNNATISAYKGSADMTMPEIYYLMDHNYASNTATNPTFTVHNFSAYADRTESYVRQDSFVISTKLIVDLPLSNPDKLIVSAGNVYILPSKIIIQSGDKPLEFDLETWHVKTGPWHFDQYQGGLVTSGIITTNLIEFPAPHILIKPTSLKLPSAQQINLNQITLAGILDLDMKPGAKITFDYFPNPVHDPNKGHWRVVLSNQQQGQMVAGIKGLPGWPAQTEIGIYFLENFSDGFEKLTMAPNQVVNHYNVIQQTVNHISILQGGVSLAGSTHLGIPNLSGGSSASFIYYVEQSEVKVRLQGLVTNFETTGQVSFHGDQQHERFYLNWNHFEVTGGLTIYDDLSPNDIKLRAKLIKKPNDIRIKIIDVDAGGQLEGNNKQTIVLGGGQNGVKRVLQGEQRVVQQSWDFLGYQGQFMGFGGGFQDGQDLMWFKVTGALTNDASKGDEVKLANIETPFGDFALSMDFGEMALVGDLRVANIPMGAVNILEGVINMRMGGLGFYLVAHLRAIYPVIGELSTNFIVGSYPHLNPDAKQILKQGMYIQKLPQFLEQSGIQGLYICANKTFFEIDWEVDLLVFGIGIYANAGIDARFWLNFGQSYGGAHLGGLAYADFELYVSVLMVCEMCVGIMAELGFNVTYQWVPTTDFSISTCGTIGFNVGFCGTSFNETAKLELGWSSSSGDVYFDAELGASCSGNASTSGSGCKHF